MSDVSLPQSLAAYECGEGRSSLTFHIEDPSDSSPVRAEDDIYDYAAVQSDFPITGTLFVRSKTTGEMKTIPVSQLLQIQRRSRLSEFAPVENADTADLISNFGSRAAKRIYNLRQQTVK
jgi:hypothetical protein